MADEIDYKLIGDDLQAVIITLDPGEMVHRRSRRDDVHAGRHRHEHDPRSRTRRAAACSASCSPGAKRALSGNTFFITTFANAGNTRQDVAFSSHFPGKIRPVDLREWNGTLIAQKDCFPLRRARHQRHHRVHSHASAPASSVAKASSCSASRATVSPSCTRRARSPRSTSRRANRFASTPDVSSRCQQSSRLRHRDGAGNQDRAVRRRRTFLRASHGPGTRDAADPAVLTTRRPHPRAPAPQCTHAGEAMRRAWRSRSDRRRDRLDDRRRPLAERSTLMPLSDRNARVAKGVSRSARAEARGARRARRAMGGSPGTAASRAWRAGAARSSRSKGSISTCTRASSSVCSDRTAPGKRRRSEFSPRA